MDELTSADVLELIMAVEALLEESEEFIPSGFSLPDFPIFIK